MFSYLYFQTTTVGGRMRMVSQNFCATVIASMTALQYGEGYAPGCALYVCVSQHSFDILLIVTIQVINALTQGKGLGIDEGTWRRLIPVDDAVKSLETLMDVITDVPLLLEKSDEIIKSGTEDLEHCRNLLAAFQKIVTWQQWCKLSSTKPLYWAVPTRSHNPSEDGLATQLFPFALEYECLNVAMLFIFSSAVMLQVLSAALLLQRAGGLPEGDINQQFTSRISDDLQVDANGNIHLVSQLVDAHAWSISRIRSEGDKIARFLCQSTEYCFRREMGTVGTQAMCHPQYTLRNYLRQVGLVRELDWCINIRNMKGPDLGRGLVMMMFGNEENEI
jgi:hypothetical protein